MPPLVARLLALLLVASPGVLASDPREIRAGVVERTVSLALEGSPEAVDLYRPAGGAPRAVVILAHGFTRSRANLVELGRDLAASGFAVVVPNLPYLVDHDGNGRALARLAERIERGADPDLDLGSRRVIFVGFSAGGLAALLGAAGYSRALGWIGLDPVDRADRGLAAAPRLAAPAYVFRAPAAACNAHSNSLALIERLPAIVEHRVVRDASHCDFEAPTDAFCELACGRADPARQAAIRAAVVAAAASLASR
jgi:dienelactone hydrolase